MNDALKTNPTSDRPAPTTHDQPATETPPRVHTDGSSADAGEGHETGGGQDGTGPGPTGS